MVLIKLLLFFLINIFVVVNVAMLKIVCLIVIIVIILYILTCLTKISWFSYLFCILIISGLIVLFFYMSSLNDKNYNFEIKNLVYFVFWSFFISFKIIIFYSEFKFMISMEICVISIFWNNKVYVILFLLMIYIMIMILYYIDRINRIKLSFRLKY